ncbi:MAG: endonuclease NucS domain-containing protein [Desulfomonilaceae bacterium]
MTLLESQIEDVFEAFYKQLLSQDLTLVGRQCIYGNRRVDLLFKDEGNRSVVVELKRDAPTKEDLGQLLEYAGLIENPRMVLVAPIISSLIKRAFDHYGIEYLEYSLKKISELHDLIKDKPKPPGLYQKMKIPDEVIAEPLVKSKRDGNIAFKVKYVGSSLTGVCSDSLYEYYLQQFKRSGGQRNPWCGTQSTMSPNCRSEQYRNPSDLDSEFFPCYDSAALKTLSFESGWYHSGEFKDTPIRCLKSKVDKLAFFTSREPSESESERFIFAIGQMMKIFPGDDESCERFVCNRETAVIFEHPHFPRFWNGKGGYYANRNSDRIVWGTLLYRYIDDKVARNFLLDIVNKTTYSANQRERARNLLKLV